MLMILMTCVESDSRGPPTSYARKREKRDL